MITTEKERPGQLALSNRFDLEWIKRNISPHDILNRLGLPGDHSRNVCASPLRPSDRSPSFSIWKGYKDYWYCKDHGGDNIVRNVIDFAIALCGNGFSEAVNWLGTTFQAPVLGHGITLSTNVYKPLPCSHGVSTGQLITSIDGISEEALNRPVLNWIDFPTHMPYRERFRLYCELGAKNLRYNSALINKVAAWKNVSPDMIRNLSGNLPDPVCDFAHTIYEPPCLGWLDGKLLFIYDTGVKIRGVKGVTTSAEVDLTCPKEDRLFAWSVGKPFIWRGWRLAHDRMRQAIEHVYITEGESDCMVFLNTGLEQLEPYSLCVALPSASTFPREWAPLFEGKAVTFISDNDQAGRMAWERLKTELLPVAKEFARCEIAKHYGVKDLADVHMQFPEVDLLEAIEEARDV